MVRRGRPRFVIVGCTLFLLLLTIWLQYPHIFSDIAPETHQRLLQESSPSQSSPLANRESLIELVDTLLKLFREHQPVPDEITLLQPAETSDKYQGAKLKTLFEPVPTDLERMKQIHNDLVDNIPKYSSQLFTGRGIVMVAGGRFLRISLLSLRMLRRSGTKLPVELWMGKKDEYDANFCAEAEKLDVRCRLLNDYVGEAIQKYQLKAFAMLLSSFSEVLFLDADNFPVVPIED